MTTKRYLVITLTYFCLQNIIYAQEDNSILAKIGANEIAVENFKNRYEFMPHLNNFDDDPEIVKREFLYSLIAEKLWALEAADKRFDTLEIVKYSIESLRRLLIKDELYKHEIEPKIKISNEEINSGLQRIAIELSVNIISTKDSTEIFNVSALIKNDADFDSLLADRKESDLQKSPVRITFGSLEDEKIEDLLYKMKPGSISSPVKSGDGWFIFKLTAENKNPAIKTSTDHARNLVFKTLQDKKIAKVGGAYLDSLIGGKRIEADRKIFNSIYETLFNILSVKYQDNLSDSIFNFSLSEKEILQTINSMNSNDLNNPFIKFEDDPSSAKDFLYYLYYQKVNYESLSSEHIKKILNNSVKHYIEDEMLVREGIKRGLVNSGSIRNDIALWRGHYLAQLMMNSFIDSVIVSDDELNDFIKLKNSAKDSLRTLNDEDVSSESKELFRSQLKLKKLHIILTEKTIEFARKYSVSIYEQILNSIDMSELNTFTYRLIGFGGRLAAFPITIPMYEWYYKMKEENLFP